MRRISSFSSQEGTVPIRTTYTTEGLAATLTLTDDGECKLKLPKGEELACWQFRKRVLEDLFLNTP